MDLFKNSAIDVKVIPEDAMTESKNNVPNALDVIPGIMNITKIYWQRGIDVVIQLYGYEHLHKEVKLSKVSSLCNVSSVEPDDVVTPEIESPVEEELTITDLQLKNRVSIYKSIYSSSSEDDEDLMAISLRQQTKEKQIGVEASTSYGKENIIHPNLIFCL